MLLWHDELTIKGRVVRFSRWRINRMLLYGRVLIELGLMITAHDFFDKVVVVAVMMNMMSFAHLDDIHVVHNFSAMIQIVLSMLAAPDDTNDDDRDNNAHDWGYNSRRNDTGGGCSRIRVYVSSISSIVVVIVVPISATCHNDS